MAHYRCRYCDDLVDERVESFTFPICSVCENQGKHIKIVVEKTQEEAEEKTQGGAEKTQEKAEEKTQAKSRKKYRKKSQKESEEQTLENTQERTQENAQKVNIRDMTSPWWIDTVVLLYRVLWLAVFMVELLAFIAFLSGPSAP